MTTTILCTTGAGVQTIRKDFKKRSEIKIKGPTNYLFHTIRINNVPLTYQSSYINWENYNCCGGWVVDREYLNHAVQNDRKLYAGILRRDLPDLIPSLEGSGLYYGEEPEYPALAYICKPGCVADYIDMEAIFADYERLGISFSLAHKDYLNELAQFPIHAFSTIENIYELDYSNPDSPIQLVFVGLLLGYPLESTAYLLEQWGWGY